MMKDVIVFIFVIFRTDKCSFIHCPIMFFASKFALFLIQFLFPIYTSSKISYFNFLNPPYQVRSQVDQDAP